MRVELEPGYLVQLPDGGGRGVTGEYRDDPALVVDTEAGEVSAVSNQTSVAVLEVHPCLTSTREELLALKRAGERSTPLVDIDMA